MGWFDDLIRDVRHTCRLLGRSPVFAATAVMSLALGIGATSAIFSLADATLLRPLPVDDPDGIVTISAAGADDRRGGLSYPNYRDLRAQSQSFDGLIAHQRATFSFAQSRQAARDMRVGTLVSDNFFDVLGVRAALGRTFVADEGRVPGRDAVVVLAYDFWRNVLAGSESILDRSVSINGIDFTVVGVLPASFRGTDAYIRPAFYVPIAMADRLTPPAGARSPLEDRGIRSFIVKGRLKSSVSQRAAQAELATIWARLENEYPEVNGNRTLTVRSELQTRLLSDPLTAVFMGMMTVLVATVLVIACANVANLMLGRSRALARDGGADRARRRTGAARSSTADREHRDRADWLRAGTRVRVRRHPFLQQHSVPGRRADRDRAEARRTCPRRQPGRRIAERGTVRPRTGVAESQDRARAGVEEHGSGRHDRAADDRAQRPGRRAGRAVDGAAQWEGDAGGWIPEGAGPRSRVSNRPPDHAVARYVVRALFGIADARVLPRARGSRASAAGCRVGGADQRRAARSRRHARERRSGRLCVSARAGPCRRFRGRRRPGLRRDDEDRDGSRSRVQRDRHHDVPARRDC